MARPGSRKPEREFRVAREAERIAATRARPSKAPSPEPPRGRAPQGRDPVTFREAALESVLDLGYVDAVCGSTSTLIGCFNEMVPAPETLDPHEIDALVHDLVAVAPLRDAGSGERFRADVVAIVRFAKGLLDGSPGRDPTEKQLLRSIEKFRADMRALAARFDPANPEALSPEARALLRRRGGDAILPAIRGTLGATEQILEQDDLGRVGHLGRGGKGAGSVQREFARRLARLFAAHVGEPSASWDDTENSYDGAFVRWCGVILRHLDVEIGASVLREAAQRLRRPS